MHFLPHGIILTATAPETRSVCVAMERLLNSTRRPASSIHTGAYRIQDVLIAATGIGKDNVEKTLTKILEQYRPAFIINIGLAGTLTHTLKRFSCLDISYVCTPTASRYAVPLCSYHSQASLVTVSKPVENESTARQLNESTGAELVDMEAAHIVEKATAHALPCRIIKIVSDYADRETRADFAHTLVHAHDAFFTACSLAHNTVSHDRK